MIVKGGFFQHVKVADFRRLTGNPLAEVWLLRIWDRACQARRWEFDGMEAARLLALWAGYEEPPERLYRALKTAGFVDEESGRARLHDFEEHQGQFLQRLEASRKGAERRRELAAKRRDSAKRTGSRTDTRKGERTETRTDNRTGAKNNPSGLADGIPDGIPDGEPVLGIRYSSSKNPPCSPPVGGTGERVGNEFAAAAVRVLGCLERSGTWGMGQSGAVALGHLEVLAKRRGAVAVVEEAEWYEANHGLEFVPQFRMIRDLAKWDGIRNQMERRGVGGEPVERGAAYRVVDFDPEERGDGAAGVAAMAAARKGMGV